MDDEKNKLIDALTEAISKNPGAEAMFNTLIPDEDSAKSDSGQKATADTSSGIDLSVILKLNQMMSGFKAAEDDDRSRLLSAIKPFLSEERRTTIDSAIKLLKVASLIKLARELDLFKDFNF